MIQVESLTKRYGPTLAVDNLSFTLTPGRVTGFLGPNGSGKSTTMRCILGLDRPTSGRATIGGVPYWQLTSPLTTVGALLDGRAFHPGRTAQQHLRSIAITHGIPAARVDEVLALTGLTAVAKRKLRGFSLGMGQRVGIAAALLGDPEVLLFDEPVNGLDPEGVRWVRQLMKQLASEGRTILVSSHLMSEMALTADDLIIIGRGRLIASGSIESFTESAANTIVFIGGPVLSAIEKTLHDADISYERVASDVSGAGRVAVRGGNAQQLGHILGSAGVEVHELNTTHRSLEDIFMEITGEAVDYQAGVKPGAYGPWQPGPATPADPAAQGGPAGPNYPHPDSFPGTGGIR
ncbi:ABC-2 type transport system ATP-binding protein [Actinobaculum suis]|uniref:ABC-2 type transport system ATP-binding protein n=1 Tax=Actinobaculum suis TaxID=1657 RepID=A0A0K9EUQ3_9ACTO|nr:ATP-binding cassette domain-containing protein [Actinobaculum suis]KMY23873.1 ABC transporter [Actinobaculum suis]MDY5153590.1 ATP-binding cassette domain-containing protein [Actinobaculum suis]SDE24401.1 ABC-2 type transport system ATP-binding protein [Actinobaculum suis]